MAYSLLIVEDDFELARNVCDYFELKGYLTDHAADVATARHLLQHQAFDLIMLDLGLPGGDGMKVCEFLRKELKLLTPVVMLTAKDDLDIKVSAFEVGADDYIVKPTALREVEARIRALIRRMQRVEEQRVLQVHDLRFDLGAKTVERAGIRINLPPIPLTILRKLMANAPNVVLSDSLLKEVWGDEPCDMHVLTMQMHLLRNAVDRPFDRQLIHTVRGFGYRIADE